MNDDDIYEILKYLSLEEKVRLSSVSKQFMKCVNHLLKCQKYLIISVVSYKKFKRDGFNHVLDNSEDELNVNSFSEKYESIAKKLENLKCIKLRLEAMDHTFCEWIHRLFPQI
jgi:hypothetical protein